MLGGFAVLVEAQQLSQYNDAVEVWPLVLLLWGAYFAGAMALIIGIRSLVGLWSIPDLPMLPEPQQDPRPAAGRGGGGRRLRTNRRTCC